jgi:hypothetical protein
MKSHSKGPWKECGDEIKSAEGEVICQTFAVEGDEGMHHFCGESDANSRLIVSAPELLDALKRTARALELVFSKQPLRDMAETLAEANALITKLKID